MLLSLILLFPLVGFIINGAIQLVASTKKSKPCPVMSGSIASLAMFLSFVVSLFYFNRLHALPENGRLFEEIIFQWINIGALHLDFSIRFDSLSSIFTLVITGVGTLIHVYSIGYMKEDATPARYFSYLNFFCFMMLILVLGSSLPIVFLGWEGVGLASYLLIGYWYQDFLKVKAGQKAFIMNRIGDLGFLLAMFVAFQYVGTLDLLKLNQMNAEPAIITLFSLLIFFACTGKSAQIPLFTWLPDAMAGPTPVSALIHAATMVTSGIYLLTRLSVTISSSSLTMSVIAVVGVMTAFIAATIACAQNDIKKILAYSTVSQLGFMFLACGVGAFDSAVFHVVTHAFFKALMFLGAGSVIHALHEEQNIFKMGNLKKKLPWTTITFVVGWASIIGLPPFSGFFSKDEILYKSLSSEHGNFFLCITAGASAFLTAFYMTRLLVLVFFGQSRVEAKKLKNMHESPWVMLIPLLVLSIFSLVGGWFGSPYLLKEVAHGESHTTEIVVMVMSVVFALIAALIAFKKYNQMKVEEKPNAFLAEAWRIDAGYLFVFVGATQKISEGLFQFIEEAIVQRSIRWMGALTQLSGSMMRTFQVGSIQAYLMMMVLMIAFVLLLLVYGVG